MKQRALDFEPPIQPVPQFYGPGYDPGLDKERLSRHCSDVLYVLRANRERWLTYEELGSLASVPVGSVRTRVSNLKGMGHEIEHRTRDDRFREVRLA